MGGKCRDLLHIKHWWYIVIQSLKIEYILLTVIVPNLQSRCLPLVLKIEIRSWNRTVLPDVYACFDCLPWNLLLRLYYGAINNKTNMAAMDDTGF